MVGAKISLGSPTFGYLAANCTDHQNGGTLGCDATLGAWTGGADTDNSGAFSSRLFCWILAIGRVTIKPFLVTLMISRGERRGHPGGGIGGFGGQAILAVGHATIKLFLVTLVTNCGERHDSGAAWSTLVAGELMYSTGS